MMEKKYLIWFVVGVVFAFIIRILLTPYGNHWDLTVNTDWSEWIHFNGPYGFYENRVWIYIGPSQLPLINLIYGFNYVIFEKILWLITAVKSFLTIHNVLPGIFKYWFNFETWFDTYYSNTQFKIGQIISMKLIPIFTDIVIGLVIFILGSKYINRKKALLASLLYLFIPYTFYISSLWGQYDQLSALCLLLSFCFIYIGKESVGKLKNWYLPLSIIFYFISVEVKPTAFFTAPFYVYYILKQKPRLWCLILSSLVGLELFLITTIPFTKGNPFSYTIKTIIPIVFNEGRNITSTHAFNLWGLISPIEQGSLNYSVLGIKAILWSYLFLTILNVISIFIISKRDNLKSMFIGLFIITGGFYIFTTGMLDRYYFTGLIFFLILTMFYKKTLLLWLSAALLFSLNLFFSFGYPYSMNFNLLNVFWVNYPLVRILSLLQLILFVLMVIISLKNNISIERNRSRIK